jgi:3-oxoacyl-[acyl-carrier protein] reductase
VLTRGYAARLANDGITVDAVAPALIDAEMTAPGAAARVPVGRLGTAEETAQVVVMVAANGYVTGQTVPVNGGLYLI